MKYAISISLIFFLTACGQQTVNTQLQNQVDSLRLKLDNAYKPGLGEFMTGIQLHHSKLWFAATTNNWKLADFEINEILETIDDIRKYNTDRPEVKNINMIMPAIDSIQYAISQHNLQLFKNSYTLLTNTCNNCHTVTNHEFNVITIPAAPPVTDQKF